ncbi:hypothetical protein Dde_1105 [Oleidesulfovibrio alaskensis G20]|jgi:hypothetical protein|uniref:Uncharacterized protein n=1 Tax=Oleidesulfovibrio alaskensis (strain ATCC BAA-1058 / DSM 17464 / G20) TaxID=207559 RepID=Q313J0_OLEA2|nr:hypothetical protein [Oleidesulfovibrio alaskensis]ABB37906.2 hypothetical protein Dde_1105 [Oleidesulfovibrio alaskensis G20]MBL3582506.1 hypothetical protein [Oleidesulfovibrio alaskensis]
METNPPADVSLPDNIPDVEALVARYDRELQSADAEIARLRSAEDLKKGIFFASEIHAAVQMKNSLTVQRQFAVNRLNRLRMETAPF